MLAGAAVVMAGSQAVADTQAMVDQQQNVSLPIANLRTLIASERVQLDRAVMAQDDTTRDNALQGLEMVAQTIDETLAGLSRYDQIVSMRNNFV